MTNGVEVFSAASWWFSVRYQRTLAAAFMIFHFAVLCLNNETTVYPLALLAYVQLVNIWKFSICFFAFFFLRVCQPQAPSELKSLWQGCSHFPLIQNEVYPAPDELNFLCQKPAISEKIMNNARRIPFQISLWGRGSNCEEIKFPLLSLSTSNSAAADNVVRFASVWRSASS